MEHERAFTVFPQHTNMHPPMVFGGEMMAQMDLCAAECIRKKLMLEHKELVAVTTMVKDLTFYVGAEVGDLITFYATIIKYGIKSITVRVEGHRLNPTKSEKICDGTFIFVTKREPTDKRGFPHELRVDWS